MSAVNTYEYGIALIYEHFPILFREQPYFHYPHGIRISLEFFHKYVIVCRQKISHWNDIKMRRNASCCRGSDALKLFDHFLREVELVEGSLRI